MPLLRLTVKVRTAVGILKKVEVIPVHLLFGRVTAMEALEFALTSKKGIDRVPWRLQLLHKKLNDVKAGMPLNKVGSEPEKTLFAPPK